MSEWDAHVYCTCFRDGLTTEPPYPRTQLTVNRFGVVTKVGSADHSNDPDDLINWRRGDDEDWSSGSGGSVSPCAHDRMQLVSVNPFYTPANWPRRETPYPQLEGLVTTAGSSALNEVFYRERASDFPSGGIWIAAAEAEPVYIELLGLLPLLPANLQFGDAYFVKNFRSLLEASIQTGNPIICHYNGIGDDAW